jgi:hypothetical protein
MPRRTSDEVRIMESLRSLPKEKREVVLNLAVAEFRPSPRKGRKPKSEVPVGPTGDGTADLQAFSTEKPRKGRRKKAAE